MTNRPLQAVRFVVGLRSLIALAMIVSMLGSKSGEVMESC